MKEGGTQEYTRLRLRALALGTGVFLLFVAVTQSLSTFVSDHQRRELAYQLEQDRAAIHHRLETALSERITLIKQAAFFWVHLEDVSQDNFRLYALRILSERPLFDSVAYADASLRLKWIEPERPNLSFLGLDFSLFPDRFPIPPDKRAPTVPGQVPADPHAFLRQGEAGGASADPAGGLPGSRARSQRDSIAVGALYTLETTQKKAFSIVSPLRSGGRLNGLLVGTVLLDDLAQDLLPNHIDNSRRIEIFDERSPDAPHLTFGGPLEPGALHTTSTLRMYNLGWRLEVWGTDHSSGNSPSPYDITILAGLTTAIVLGFTLGSLWLGQQRLKSSQRSLRLYADELEQANRQSEQAIDQLEATNEQLELTNEQLERTNEKLASTNHQLNDVNLELESANMSLRNLNKELDDFTHVVSHDLKEPLRGIQAFSQFLIEDYTEKIDEMGRSYLENLMSSASRMQHLINDLMQLARVTKTRAGNQQVNLNQVLKNALQDLSFSIAQRHAEVAVMGEIPLVWGDPIHLLIVCKNLLSNGLKYNERENPRIEVSWVDQGAWIEVRFRDNGIGIDPRYHTRIFELFERLVTHEQYEGTGAGLAISKKIIEQFGGSIWVDSTPGEGACFAFTLPRVTETHDWSVSRTNPRIVLPPPRKDGVTTGEFSQPRIERPITGPGSTGDT